MLRKFIGGAGLGVKILLDEVPPGVQWFDPENRFIIATGPLNGTTLGGSGCCSVITKGAMTEGAAHTEAMASLGIFEVLRFRCIYYPGRS